MAVQVPQKIIISDQMLRSWVRCRRKAWLDKYGDTQQKIWSAHSTLQINHQEKSFASFLQEKRPSSGIKSCQEGKSFIHHLKIKCKTNSGQLIEGSPSLLQKTNGFSQWGDFSYRPVICRQGHRITREHKFLLSFTGLLLTNLQKSPATEGIVLSQNKNKLEIQTINLTQILEQNLIDALPKISKDIGSLKPPPITKNRRKCSICSWQRLCDKEAKLNGHLSEVSGIGGKRIEILNSIGIENLEDLAKASPSDLENKLSKFGEQHSEIAHKLINQAFVQLTGKKQNINESQALPEIENAEGVLIYDIESDPDAHHDFLHGFIRINLKKDSDKRINYQPILITKINNEQLVWKRLQRKLYSSPNWPILHYGETEALAICKIAKSQGLTQKEIQNLKMRFIDIHERVRKHWVLPLSSYGLKAVASSIGFRWSQNGADGPLALLWWRQWKSSNTLEENHIKNLKKIFRYNKDDCLATWEIAKWLSGK